MANHIQFQLLLLLLIVIPSAFAGRVGGRTQLKNVEGNREVQDLGRYCVQEYNRQLHKANSSSGKLLVFSRVVEAETQVVSGVKYYLKISAAAGASPRTFEAVVLVKPWLRSKELLSFAPSSPSRNTK